MNNAVTTLAGHGHNINRSRAGFLGQQFTDAHEGVYAVMFEGFGGIGRHETLVYRMFQEPSESQREAVSLEVRIPQYPEFYHPRAVAADHDCIVGLDLDDCFDQFFNCMGQVVAA